MFSREMELEMDEYLLKIAEKEERKIHARQAKFVRPGVWVYQQNRLRWDAEIDYLDEGARMTDFTWKSLPRRALRKGRMPRSLA